MEEEQNQTRGDLSLYYVAGIVALMVIASAVYILRPKSAPSKSPMLITPVAPTPTPGPITGLVCEKQYYNPVIGFKKYYLSAEGVDLPNTKTVTCETTIRVANKVVAEQKITGEVKPATERGGVSFRCVTRDIALEPQLATTVDVKVTNDQHEQATCSAVFLLPAP